MPIEKHTDGLSGAGRGGLQHPLRAARRRDETKRPLAAGSSDIYRVKNSNIEFLDRGATMAQGTTKALLAAPLEETGISVRLFVRGALESVGGSSA